jgi:hypothetical protein
MKESGKFSHSNFLKQIMTLCCHLDSSSNKTCSFSKCDRTDSKKQINNFDMIWLKLCRVVEFIIENNTMNSREHKN